MEHETIRGRLLYTSKKPHIFDKVRGGETYLITQHIDGRRTLRAHCAIDENSRPECYADSFTSLDARLASRRKPSFRSRSMRHLSGSAWYRFTDRLGRMRGLIPRSRDGSAKNSISPSPTSFFRHAPDPGRRLAHPLLRPVRRGRCEQIVPNYFHVLPGIIVARPGRGCSSSGTCCSHFWARKRSMSPRAAFKRCISGSGENTRR